MVLGALQACFSNVAFLTHGGKYGFCFPKAEVLAGETTARACWRVGAMESRERKRRVHAQRHPERHLQLSWKTNFNKLWTWIALRKVGRKAKPECPWMASKASDNTARWLVWRANSSARQARHLGDIGSLFCSHGARLFAPAVPRPYDCCTCSIEPLPIRGTCGQRCHMQISKRWNYRARCSCCAVLCGNILKHGRAPDKCHCSILLRGAFKERDLRCIEVAIVHTKPPSNFCSYFIECHVAFQKQGTICCKNCTAMSWCSTLVLSSKQTNMLPATLGRHRCRIKVRNYIILNFCRLPSQRPPLSLAGLEVGVAFGQPCFMLFWCLQQSATVGSATALRPLS